MAMGEIIHTMLTTELSTERKTIYIIISSWFSQVGELQTMISKRTVDVFVSRMLIAKLTVSATITFSFF